ncbi:MAG: helix-turn-helix domain-containing protein [Klebsiella quasipneumoniae]|nr:helix-turn-helix domain-containing protein [Klebsiella quasipneumoniae]
MTDKKEIIDNLIVWMENHIDDRLDIDTLAKKSGYSKWHLQRLFYKYTGIKIGGFIRYMKLSKAANLLLRSEEPIIKLALRHGYESQQSFTRSFTRKYGVSPYKYRKNGNKSINEK